MVALNNSRAFIKNDKAFAVVEATIIFPFVIMIFISFIFLAMYLPTSVSIQRSAARAASIASAYMSDTFYAYDVVEDKAGMDYPTTRREIYEYNAYIARKPEKLAEYLHAGEDVLTKYLDESFFKGTNLTTPTVRIDPADSRYILVTVEQRLKLPFNFPILPISNELVFKETVRTMVRDADTFIRNMDLVYDVTIKKAEKVTGILDNFADFLDIFNIIKGFFRF